MDEKGPTNLGKAHPPYSGNSRKKTIFIVYYLRHCSGVIDRKGSLHVRALPLIINAELFEKSF